jgi:uncharacterized protein involved in type VI secretion and phage assembly
MNRISGVVRGIVSDTGDPSGGGRAFVRLPALHGSGGAWAPVCRAFGGPSAGGTLAGPGGAVWVAFEDGDPDRPVILGRAD